MSAMVQIRTLPLHNNCYFQNLVILSDFNCGIANAQVEMRFRGVFEYILRQGQNRTTLPKEIELPTLPKGMVVHPPAVMSVGDIPFANVDYAAYAMYCCTRALGRSRPNLYIHITDPGVGEGEDRTLLVTDWGNMYIGPNNGSLGLLKIYFEQRAIQNKLYAIDLERVQELEQHRMEEPTYHIPRTFHGRDVFAVVAGLLAGGVEPEVFCIGKKEPVIQVQPYASHIQDMPFQLKKPMKCWGFRDNTYGNLKTNLTTDQVTYDQLVEEGAQFKVTHEAEGRFGGKGKSLIFTARKIFSDMERDEPLVYLGSTFAPAWDDRFVELALNLNDASAALGVPPHYSGAHELTIERLK